jgi:hypothetical protein
VAGALTGQETIGAGLRRGGNPSDGNRGGFGEGQGGTTDETGVAENVVQTRLEVTMDFRAAQQQRQVAARDANGRAEVDLAANARREADDTALILDEFE